MMPVSPVPLSHHAVQIPRPFYVLESHFLDSYSASPEGTTCSHNYNLLETNASGYNTLQGTVPVACNALRGQLNVREVGNEPDLYMEKWRPSNWKVEQ